MFTFAAFEAVDVHDPVIVVPPARAVVDPPLKVDPAVPTGMPPDALAMPVVPPTPGDSESEVPQPATVKTRPNSANIERDFFLMVNLQGSVPQSQ